MVDQALQAFMTRHPMLQGLPRPHLEVIASYASLAHYEPHQRVFRYGTSAQHFYIVQDGRVSVEIPAVEGAPLPIQKVGKGDVLGWSWLVPPYQWRFDARALEPSRIVVIDGERVRSHCEEDPKLGFELMKRFASLMAERLICARQVAIEHYTGDHLG
jgi:CRP/FNR family cyclic AMP-dependent transcriptional regulator